MGLGRLDKSNDLLIPGFFIRPEICLTIQVENVHAVSHFKHLTFAALEYVRDYGNNMKESLKVVSLLTHHSSYYLVPQTKAPLRNIPMMKRFLFVRMRQWTSEHEKAVRQLTIRQNNTKHTAGTLLLNMYWKELPVGDQVTEKFSSPDDRLSEYDSDSSDDKDSVRRRDRENFLSTTVRTHTRRPIQLSY